MRCYTLFSQSPFAQLKSLPGMASLMLIMHGGSVTQGFSTVLPCCVGPQSFTYPMLQVPNYLGLPSPLSFLLTHWSFF